MVIWCSFGSNFDVPFDGSFLDVNQVKMLFIPVGVFNGCVEYPVSMSCATEVFSVNPFVPFVRMTTFSPSPQSFEDVRFRL